MKINALQTIIDKCRCKFNKSACRFAARKYKNFVKSKDNIKVLVLGSSHGEYGFIPREGEYNLSLASQDLYYSYKLCEKYIPEMPNLKTIVLFYSVFSRGFELEKTREAERCFHYLKLFGIDFKTKECKKKVSKYEKPIFKYLDECIKDIPEEEYYGENPQPDVFEDFTAEHRVERHLKNNRRNNNQTEYVRMIYELAKKYKKEVITVIPPAREDYVKLLPCDSELFPELFKISGEYSAKLFQFLKDTGFCSEDFGDSDHTNREGAAKLTAKIRVWNHNGEGS